MRICISEEFSETPGARYKCEGDNSGEEFRESMLIPRYRDARRLNEKLLVDLDGSYGYPTSFLDEAFGGLARIFGSDEVLDTLEFKSEDEPSLVKDIHNYILGKK